MAQFPVITSACPLRFASMPSEGRDFCGQCQRRVHNLDGMDEAQRKAFFASCAGEVCVAYTVKRPQRMTAVLRAGAAAVALGVSGLALAADAVPAADANAPAFEDVVTGPTCDPASKLESVVLMGGTRAASVEWLDESELARAEAPQIGEIDASEWLPAPGALAPR